jgi:hypothetical protein
MGVFVGPSTLDGGVTPICNSCGIALCWDISDGEYEEAKAFWDKWKCKECNPETYSGALKQWKQEHEIRGSKKVF